MAKEDEYLTYEQVLQELQINRSQLNRLVRDGRIVEHVVEGETKFRAAEVAALKKELEKRPTVVAAEGEVGTDVLEEKEPTTDVLEGAGAAAGEGRPGTEVLEEKAEAPDTELVEEGAPQIGAERDTELVEEAGAPAAAGLDLGGLEESDLELEKPLAEEPSASESALETDLDLEAAQPEEAEAEAEESDFFDFSAELEEGELELEGRPEAAAEQAEGPREEAEAGEEPVGELLDIEQEQEVPEEDLLSEIMDIEEEEQGGEAAPEPSEATEEVTAEITAIEQPTYEESELGEALEVEPVDAGEEFPEGEELELPYAAPVVETEGQVTGGWVALLAVCLILMVFAAIFVIDNGSRPDFAAPLTSLFAGG